MDVLLVFFNLFLLTAVCGKKTKKEDDESKTPEEELYGVKYARECEVCKYFVLELENRLAETGKSHDVIETGYQMDSSLRKKKKYAQSELRLVESLDGICERLLEYNIHKERKDSTRFAKGMSTTFKVLHDLVDKGVKVELGIPEELWDKPSAEITNLKSQCENLMEKHEADIEDWYFNHQDVPLKEFLCIERALRKGDDGCFEDLLLPAEESEKEEEKKEEKPKKKKKKGKKKKEEHSGDRKEDKTPKDRTEL